MTILTALAAGPQHGYGILREVESLSVGLVAPPVGSLYRLLDRLLDDGLIEEDSSDVVDGRFRRYYRLTETGRSELAKSAVMMSSLATKAKRRLAATARQASPLRSATA